MADPTPDCQHDWRAGPKPILICARCGHVVSLESEEAPRA